MRGKKLETLLRNHGKREKFAGGEVFAFWGVLNLTGIGINVITGRNSYITWLIIVTSGILIQSLYIGLILRRRNFKLFWEHKMIELWTFIVILLPLLFFIFPNFIKLYPPRAIMSLVTLWLGIALLMSGLLVGVRGFKFGSVAMFLSSLLLAYYPDKEALIYSGAVIAGLLIPGAWSKYEEIPRV